MHDYQSAFLNMCHAVDVCIKKHQSTWAATSFFSEAYDAFKAVMAGVAAHTGAQSVGTKALTQEKKAKRQAFEAALLRLSQCMQSYAVVNSDEALARTVKTSASALVNATEAALLGKAQLICDAATPLLPSLAPFGVTADMLDQIKTLNAAFSSLIGKPQEQIKTKAKATAALAADIKALRAILKDQLDIMVRVFADVNPSFVSTYFTCRTIVDPGHRKRALRVTITDAATGKVLQGVLAEIKKEKLKKKSNANGRFVVQHMKEGEQQIIFRHPNYAPLTAKAMISKGSTTMLNIALQPAQE